MNLSKTMVLALLACPAPVLMAADAPAPPNLAPNPEFSQGRDQPEGWTVGRGDGRWADRARLELRGGGSDLEFWQSAPVHVEPGRTYRFEARVRRPDGAPASVVAGPDCANRDHRVSAGDWQTIGHVFRAPDAATTTRLRLGVWETKGAVQFENVTLSRVLPVDLERGGVQLGEGESIVDGRYVFSGAFSHEGSNRHRPLAVATASFNSNRWIVSDRAQITYRFELPGARFTEGDLGLNVNHHVKGDCLVEISPDGRAWQAVAQQSKVGAVSAKVPAALCPAGALWVRIRADGPGAYFQVDRIDLDAAIQGPRAQTAFGRTTYATVATTGAPSLDVRAASLSERPDGRRGLALTLRNLSTRPLRLEMRSTPQAPITIQLAPESESKINLPLPATRPGRNDFPIHLVADGRSTLRLDLPIVVSDFERDDYGELIGTATAPGAGSVWWCDATRKVPRERALPARSGQAARLSAARNDHEAVQVVIRPPRALSNLTARMSAFSGPGGAVIPAGRVQVLRVRYHLVTHPTDPTSTPGWWPDALPPLSKPIDVPDGVNQPLWVLVDVPADAAPGDYSATLALSADGYKAYVPVRLHVWNVTLPERNHLATAYGFSPGLAFRYHNITTEADKRKLVDLYLQSFAAHRISPYDPAPLDPIRVRFRDDVSPPRADLDFKAFDTAMARAVSTYHFTHFRLHLEGMGGGTFASRVEPQIGKHRAGSPEYEAMFSSYVGQIVEHLRAKGWLEMAYVYWFDEPEPVDYEFVRAGMARLKKYAPGLTRMLTEEPSAALDGAVDLWCPVTPNYDQKETAPRQARGDRFWWYVCTVPKAPYCTLFIDHPAAELRVWHWQTWQRRFTGNLIWTTNWWTCQTAFPDRPQNPYEDPMSYAQGYGVAPGTKHHWGNGDGRFLYPPESAAVPGLNGGKPVLEAPVSSLRWEMLREGVEDYEMLYLLRERLNERRGELDTATAARYAALLEVPASITRDLTTFTTDPSPIYERRAEVARAIEELSR